MLALCLIGSALGRLGADKMVNITEYQSADCTGTVKRVQSFTLDKCAKTINRLASCKSGVANVTWYEGDGCTGAINSTYAYTVSQCSKQDKKHSYLAVCY